MLEHKTELKGLNDCEKGLSHCRAEFTVNADMARDVEGHDCG
jgi:hypothetical protein